MLILSKNKSILFSLHLISATSHVYDDYERGRPEISLCEGVKVCPPSRAGGRRAAATPRATFSYQTAPLNLQHTTTHSFLILSQLLL